MGSSYEPQWNYHQLCGKTLFILWNTKNIFAEHYNRSWRQGLLLRVEVRLLTYNLTGGALLVTKMENAYILLMFC